MNGMERRGGEVGEMRDRNLLKHTFLENAMIIFNVLSANLKINK